MFQGNSTYFFMIRYPQGIQKEGNNGTIRRNDKADKGRTGREAGSEESMGVSAAQADRPVGHRVMLDNDPGGRISGALGNRSLWGFAQKLYKFAIYCKFIPFKLPQAHREPAVLLLKNSTAKGAKRHEKAKYATSKYRKNIQI
jgi:hypothetical protein